MTEQAARHDQSLAFTTTIMPAASLSLSSGDKSVKSIRTGMRCCIFTKFPAELSVGTNGVFGNRSPLKWTSPSR